MAEKKKKRKGENNEEKSLEVGAIFLMMMVATAGLAFGQAKELRWYGQVTALHACLPTILATNFGWWNESGFGYRFITSFRDASVEAGQAGEWM